MTNDQEEHDDELNFEIEIETEIPALFYSEETRRPFTHCIDCEAELLLPLGPDYDESVYYLVHKAVVRNEAVFELALCVDCQQKLREQTSEETTQAMQNYYLERFSGNPFMHRGSFEDCISACLACERSRDDCHRYSLSGMFAGAKLLLAPSPYIICSDCEMEIAELVSKKTRDAWDRFIDEHFDSPPGLEVDDWERTPILL